MKAVKAATHHASGETRIAECPCGRSVQTRDVVPAGWAFLGGLFRCRQCIVLASLVAGAGAEQGRLL